jgi:hypothetical protein
MTNNIFLFITAAAAIILPLIALAAIRNRKKFTARICPFCDDTFKTPSCRCGADYNEGYEIN